MPFFSAIIPVFNKESFLENTINSVLQQSFSDFELIVVNDGSTDGSMAIIEKFSDPRIRFFTKENGGVSSARNLGLQKASAKYISFLDADDYWYPNFLEEMASCIQEFPEHHVFSAAVEVETENLVLPSQYSISKKNDRVVVNYFEASMKTTAICTSCAVFKRSVFEKVGIFDPRLKSGQDTDMWIRIGLIYPVVFSFKILARYVYDPESLSKNKAYFNRKLDFSKFIAEEKNNLPLKKFLDLNRYSFAMTSKLSNDNENYRRFKKDIDLFHLNLRKKILLKLPAPILNLLLQLNFLLVKLKLSKSIPKGKSRSH